MKLRPSGSLLVRKFKPKRYTTIVMMLIIWAGVAGSLFAGISTDLRSRDSLIGRTITVADALPASEIAQLHGEPADVDNPAYNDLKDRLEKIRGDNRDLRFVYLMGRYNGQIFFYVDSEVPTSLSYSPPGQPYSDASVRLQEAFNSDQAFIEGPVQNQRGIWISALAPIVDPSTNQVVAVAGTYVNAVNYYEQIALYAIIPLLLAAIPLAGLIRDRKLEAKEREIGQLKNQFISIASHELRSPLNGMLWAIQSLLKNKSKNLQPSQQALLTDMYRSTESSIGTINEILDLSIFERGQAHKLQRDNVDLVAILKEVHSTLTLGAQEKNLKIELVDWPSEALVVGDLSALKRAFMNLVSNAIKYSTKASTITITYKRQNDFHVVSIRDHGIGIPKNEQAKVLQGYYRAANATKVQANGTGLGLWVTRLIFEQHGGRIWLESELNKGTTMYVELPVPNSTLSKNASKS